MIEMQEGVRVSVSELAGIKGVSPQAVSKRLKRLQSEGLIGVGQRGREKTVNLAEWDTVTGETTDPARLVAQDTVREMRGLDRLDDDVARNISGGKAPADPTYTKELTRKAGYDADLRKIEIDKQRGLLLPIEDVRNAMERCAEAIVRDIDQLPAFADDLAAAVARSGVSGLRDALKAKARELRQTLAQRMSLIGAPDDEEEEIEPESAEAA